MKNNIFFNKLSDLFWLLVLPNGSSQALRRQQLIVNLVALISILALFFLIIFQLSGLIFNCPGHCPPLLVSLAYLIFFLVILWLSHQGHLQATAFLIITIFSFPALYHLINWGTDFPTALILSILIIILSGIFFGSTAIIISTLITVCLLILISWAQNWGLISVYSSWHQHPVSVSIAVTHSALISIIASVAWLFCRETSQALRRALVSERLLTEERNFLEAEVDLKTKEMLDLKSEQLKKLCRLAELGRLSSGIFHDLINPLSAISLNLEQVNDQVPAPAAQAKQFLNQALVAAKRAERLIGSLKRQLNQESSICCFCLNDLLLESLELLGYKARKAQVSFRLILNKQYQLTGDPLKFSQVLTNILANAIEACEANAAKEVFITLRVSRRQSVLSISDRGTGINPKDFSKLFKPLFSTKGGVGRGTGIGLAMSKEIIERDFSGKIAVANNPSGGAKFSIILPNKKLDRIFV